MRWVSKEAYQTAQERAALIAENARLAEALAESEQRVAEGLLIQEKLNLLLQAVALVHRELTDRPSADFDGPMIILPPLRLHH